MRAGKIQFTRGDKGSNRFISKTTALILLIGGFLLIQPFFWIVIISGVNYHYITLKALCMILMFIVGLPSFLGGIIGLLIGNAGASASMYGNHDISRMRYAVEEEARRTNGKKY